jgi:hypothetical protein
VNLHDAFVAFVNSVAFASEKPYARRTNGTPRINAYDAMSVYAALQQQPAQLAPE